ncbi:MAG: electron transport complex subunit RsxC [Deltaproteobacteria bacterium]|nr:electron transport complex subunit RsxC [Deltaproteobacteria bacterium]
MSAPLPEKALSFRHGVHPPEQKHSTEKCPIERAHFVEEYVLPLSQHLGAPSKPAVQPGQRVQRGQLIATPGGYVSTSLHAPVAGTVKAVELRPHPSGKLQDAIVIAADPYQSQEVRVRLERGEPENPSELVSRIQSAGIVGLGGAAFPTHVKLKVPEGKKVTFAILNGCECEPYLTCDHRVMLERAPAVVRGLQLIMKALGVSRGTIGLEKNKMDAYAALKAIAPSNIDVVALEVKYPQGAEKMLIDAVLHREVPSGKLPLDIEVVVNNVATAAAVTDLVDEGLPLIERAVTVTGPGIRRPANVMVPFGTPLRAVIDHCGGLLPEARQVVLGGPMMGFAQKDLDAPVVKGTSGILVLTEPARMVEEYACIRCGRCLEACPMFLNPSRLAYLVRVERPDALKAQHLLDCFECASCSFVCPSNIPLVQLMRIGKALVRKSG